MVERRALGIYQKKLAEKANVTQQQHSKIERSIVGLLFRKFFPWKTFRENGNHRVDHNFKQWRCIMGFEK